MRSYECCIPFLDTKNDMEIRRRKYVETEMLCLHTMVSPIETNEHLAVVTCDYYHLLKGLSMASLQINTQLYYADGQCRL